ncbi:sodium channel protein Nach-like [Schistocerca gregaria]|uniref:sodium channel protein Nach-like n=1 Tax=Schistocerca gregaria TaxID=7010 RepID=UPI00211E436A|nr:sodium channel protein Nach-like [Schistocerca gregaria]
MAFSAAKAVDGEQKRGVVRESETAIDVSPLPPPPPPPPQLMRSVCGRSEVRVVRRGTRGQRVAAMWRRVLAEYAQGTTLHGFRYLAPGLCGRAARLCWFIAIATSIVFAATAISDTWRKYRDSPTTTSVVSTNFPLYRIPFPGVTICPAVKVRRTVGEKLLMRYLNLSEADDVTRQKLYHVMAALALVEFPYYYMVPLSMEKAGDLVDKLNDINITRFMMQTLPTIDDVFYECFWQGHINNCSNMFFLQRTEAGFCYGFNSLAAENTRQCPAMSTYKVPTGATVNRDPCQMRRNIASGPTTGLEVFLKSLPEEESLGDGQRDRDGYRVFLQPVTEVPQAGTGLLLPPSDDHVMRVRLSVSFTESSLQVASLDVPQRSCLFPDEQPLELTNSYSQTSCLTDCRLSYIISKCNCSPYFFNHIQRDLRFVKPQGQGVDGDDSSKFLDGVLDCSHCLPTCRSYSYVQEVRYESITPRTPYQGYIDVHYADVSAVKYGVDLAFDSMTLIGKDSGLKKSTAKVHFETVTFLIELNRTTTLNIVLRAEWYGLGTDIVI